MQSVEGVRHVDDAALRLDRRDGLGERHARRHGALEEETHHLAFGGLDLLPDDDPHSVAVGELATFETAVDRVVVGDGDHVEADLAGAFEDVGDPRDAVLAVPGVDVEVGEELPLLPAAAGDGVPPPAHDLVVEPLELVGDQLPVEAPRPAHAGRGQPLARLRLAHERAQRGGEGARVAARDQKTRRGRR